MTYVWAFKATEDEPIDINYEIGGYFDAYGNWITTVKLKTDEIPKNVKIIQIGFKSI